MYVRIFYKYIWKHLIRWRLSTYTWRFACFYTVSSDDKNKEEHFHKVLFCMIRNVIDNPISTSTEYFLLYKTFSNLNINQGLREINGEKITLKSNRNIRIIGCFFYLTYWCKLSMTRMMWQIDVSSKLWGQWYQYLVQPIFINYKNDIFCRNYYVIS